MDTNPEDVNSREYFNVRPFGERDLVQISHHELVQIIHARVEEIFSLVVQEIKRSGYDGLLPAGMVLTGGSSSLPGMRKVASKVLGLPVRITQPNGLVGMIDQISSPAFSTSVGLLRWATLMSEIAPSNRRRRSRPRTKESTLNLENVSNWLKRLLP